MKTPKIALAIISAVFAFDAHAIDEAAYESIHDKADICLKADAENTAKILALVKRFNQKAGTEYEMILDPTDTSRAYLGIPVEPPEELRDVYNVGMHLASMELLEEINRETKDNGCAMTTTWRGIKGLVILNQDYQQHVQRAHKNKDNPAAPETRI